MVVNAGKEDRFEIVATSPSIDMLITVTVALSATELKNAKSPECPPFASFQSTRSVAGV
jgi:hypothetical protein